MRIDGRLVINIDIDGVVYNWARAMSDYVRNYGHHPNTTTLGSMEPEVTSWQVWNDWNIPKGEFFRLWRNGIINSRIYRQGSIIPGAKEALWKLSDDEWHIRLVTDRLNHFDLHREIVTSTVKWLDDNNIPYRSLSFDSDKTHSAFIGIDVKPENIQTMDDIGMKSYLFGAGHNNSNLTWPDIYESINEFRLSRLA